MLLMFLDRILQHVLGVPSSSGNKSRFEYQWGHGGIVCNFIDRPLQIDFEKLVGFQQIWVGAISQNNTLLSWPQSRPINSF